MQRPLSDLEKDLLAFERAWWREAGVKESAIRERFGLSATKYYAILNDLLERPEAQQHDPLLVRRLRRQREARKRQRAARRLGTQG